MKDTLIFLFCAFVFVFGEEEIKLNENGCPVNHTIHKVIEHETHCNLFYICVGGEPVELRCPLNLVFNAKEEACDWLTNVDCKGKEISNVVPESEEDKEEGSGPGGNNDPSQAPAICTQDGSDGVLVAHENCAKFYICHRGLPVTLNCSVGLLYNYDLGVCDWPFNVECGDRIISKEEEATEEKIDIGVVVVNNPTPAEICAVEGSNGVLIAHETCNRFYKCSFGSPVTFSCPSGLVYNIKDELCDWSYNVQCGDRLIVPDEEEDKNDDAESEDSAGSGGHGHSDPSQAQDICAEEKSDGVLVAHENCNQFYKCSQGAPVTLDCPINLLYNAPLEYCDWPQNVDCGNRLTRSRKLL